MFINKNLLLYKSYKKYQINRRDGQFLFANFLHSQEVETLIMPNNLYRTSYTYYANIISKSAFPKCLTASQPCLLNILLRINENFIFHFY